MQPSAPKFVNGEGMHQYPGLGSDLRETSPAKPLEEICHSVCEVMKLLLGLEAVNRDLN